MSDSVVLTEAAQVPLKQMISLLETIESCNFSHYETSYNFVS